MISSTDSEGLRLGKKSHVVMFFNRWSDDDDDDEDDDDDDDDDDDYLCYEVWWNKKIKK